MVLIVEADFTLRQVSKPFEPSSNIGPQQRVIGLGDAFIDAKLDFHNLREPFVDLAGKYVRVIITAHVIFALHASHLPLAAPNSYKIREWRRRGFSSAPSAT